MFQTCFIQLFFFIILSVFPCEGGLNPETSCHQYFSGGTLSKMSVLKYNGWISNRLEAFPCSTDRGQPWDSHKPILFQPDAILPNQTPLNWYGIQTLTLTKQLSNDRSPRWQKKKGISYIRCCKCSAHCQRISYMVYISIYCCMTVITQHDMFKILINP